MATTVRALLAHPPGFAQNRASAWKLNLPGNASSFLPARAGARASRQDDGTISILFDETLRFLEPFPMWAARVLSLLQELGTGTSPAW